jgi:hypothetical protein
MSKKLCKKNMVFVFGKNQMWFFQLERTICCPNNPPPKLLLQIQSKTPRI